MYKPTPTGSPWQDLAVAARELADRADALARSRPEDLAPGAGADRAAFPDPLADLDARALGIGSLVADCRRLIWRTLHEQGWSWSDIARAWGSTPQHTRQTVLAPHRPRR
ncbi:hypothetical protein [Nocardia paucivorans]|uniref:hypothetical protein n=1 Tax=Nocardia paucivorans TaxID=114259 RepID=UPI0002FE011E|nr:hypothetical protein [Nocardia paucivorans]